MVQLENKWGNLLRAEFQKEYYKKLTSFLEEEYQTKTIFPDKQNIFRALQLTDYEDVKVVILGQDPYHRPNQANGLSFSVDEGVPLPPSLNNIFKELNNDVGCYVPNHGDLEKWANQGVLLLNTVLTVEEGKANSHQGIGWEIFTDEVIRKLNVRKKPIVFLLWGKNAITKTKFITSPNHFILTSPHPSPLSAYRGFFGNAHFSKTNAFLAKIGDCEIDWQIERILEEN
ncbi:uracil-DNA glycosylase [Bacillus timonensis]|nr:uracil-DNA glycosylase [Bacillus timonensis]